MIYDVIIIGAGVVGGAVARELSRSKVSVLALEMESDVCCGISKSNTGIIHTPCLVKGPSLKAEFNLKGNLMMDQLCSELGVTLQRPGALILAYSDEDREILQAYREQGEKTRKAFDAPGQIYKIIEKVELQTIEPNLNKEVVCALFAPDAGRIIPYELGTALWENAVSNGVALRLKHKVDSVIKPENDDSPWTVKSGKQTFQSRYVINAAGHGSEEIGQKAGFSHSVIEKVKGQYMIYKRKRDFDVNHILFQVPPKGKGKAGKGILVCKTVYGNLMIGPDARWVGDGNDTGTDRESLEEVLEGARKSIPELSPKGIIKTFAGIRPKPAAGDFIIESDQRFIHLCGIESPGLTSSPALAREVIGLLNHLGLEFEPDENFKSRRDPIVKEILNLDKDELKRRIDLPEDDKDRIVCRCEQVPRSRIIDAMNRGIRVDSLDAVKRRTRAGQGQCQGNFCGKRVRKLLSRELDIPEEEITQRGGQPLGDRINKL
ncbi:FAD-dependent oxidoreductase [Spirochaeta isovalerica]|uniref:Glycerol-3-phosphate dehydrogenase n=1 Tax=Spirochaeta isovalerica TaxID=150 RepID=A0A841R2U3_9SPIO|nr:glycerol-3-phosphate dehydrogenase [Spirochaeta isovalerica]